MNGLLGVATMASASSRLDKDLWEPSALGVIGPTALLTMCRTRPNDTFYAPIHAWHVGSGGDYHSARSDCRSFDAHTVASYAPVVSVLTTLDPAGGWTKDSTLVGAWGARDGVLRAVVAATAYPVDSRVALLKGYWVHDAWQPVSERADFGLLATVRNILFGSLADRGLVGLIATTINEETRERTVMLGQMQLASALFKSAGVAI